MTGDAATTNRGVDRLLTREGQQEEQESLLLRPLSTPAAAARNNSTASATSTSSSTPLLLSLARRVVAGAVGGGEGGGAIASTADRVVRRRRAAAAASKTDSPWSRFVFPRGIEQYPLEVRVSNLSVSAADASGSSSSRGAEAGNGSSATGPDGNGHQKSATSGGGKRKKIKTVYNSSVVYPVVNWCARKRGSNGGGGWWSAAAAKGSRSNNGDGADSPPPPSLRRQQHRAILRDVNLVFRPGRSYLLLGPPGSGKSTLLKAISGRLRMRDDNLASSSNRDGDITGRCRSGCVSSSSDADSRRGLAFRGYISYNGRTLDQNDNEYFIENAFSFIDQHDVHAPLLTVRETLEFAHKCKTTVAELRHEQPPAATTTVAVRSRSTTGDDSEGGRDGKNGGDDRMREFRDDTAVIGPQVLFDGNANGYNDTSPGREDDDEYGYGSCRIDDSDDYGFHTVDDVDGAASLEQQSRSATPVPYPAGRGRGRSRTFSRDSLYDQGADKGGENNSNTLWTTNLTLVGLDLMGETRNTYVGDSNVRGVSGGQRRRVTVGEMLTHRASVLCGDEISNGLDAASTYDMLQVLLYFDKLCKLTSIISLLQPGPDTVSLFDEVIVLADEGYVIYAGPVDEVEPYFAEIGFSIPQFMDVADFLQLVSTKDGKTLLYDSSLDRANRGRVAYNRSTRPPAMHELAVMFRKSRLGTQIQDQLLAPHDYLWKKDDPKVSQHDLSHVSSISSMPSLRHKYVNSFARSTFLIFRRFLTIWVRDRRVIIASAAKNVVMGISVGGVYFSTTDTVSIEGAFFQAVLFIMLGTSNPRRSCRVSSTAHTYTFFPLQNRCRLRTGAMQNAPSLITDRVVFYKHTDSNFYSAWPYVFGRALSQIPQVCGRPLLERFEEE